MNKRGCERARELSQTLKQALYIVNTWFGLDQHIGIGKWKAGLTVSL